MSADHPDWCWRPDCCADGSDGAHLSRPAEVHSAVSGLSAVVRLVQGVHGTPYVVVELRHPDYGPGWEAEEIPLCMDGGFARVLGRVLVNSGSEACARGYPQGVDKGWG
jgi:hypothetical protein